MTYGQCPPLPPGNGPSGTVRFLLSHHSQSVVGEVVAKHAGMPARKRPFPLGVGRNDPHMNRGAFSNDAWWQPMTDKEVEDFLEGRY